MMFKLSWLNSRKILIFAAFIDYVFYYSLFFNKFNEPILNKSILIFLCILNTLTWVISSYIFGRYENSPKGRYQILINQIGKLFLTIIFNILLNLFLFRIFWNWDYMNFKSFSNFLSNFSNFYFLISIFSFLFQLFLNFYLLKKYKDKFLWLFLGTKKREIYLKKLIGSRTNINIKFFDPEFLKDKNINIKGIIIDDEEFLKEKNIQFIFDLNNKGMKFMKVSNWCERYLNRYPSELVKTTEIIEGQFNYNKHSLKGRIKRIGESFLSLIILIGTFPIFLISALAIVLEDGGPVFYSQIRDGFEGKQFKIIKLRTMIINAETNGAQWSDSTDKRITNVGKILRKLRIDELPQLLLVLSGEMSLIGPRPERPKIDQFLRDKLPNYDLRYSIKPGISGWAQVNYPYGASIEDSKYKLSYDLYYIKNFSILLDFMILFKTLRLVLNGKGSKPIRKIKSP